MYSSCVELTLDNGSVIAFDCNVVEHEIADNCISGLNWIG